MLNENDVLDRFFKASQKFNVKNINVIIIILLNISIWISNKFILTKLALLMLPT